jgi:predicted alpha/beta-fold hydrolase
MRNGGAPAVSDRTKVPTIVFHGDRDKTVNPVNGDQVIAQAKSRGVDAAVLKLAGEWGREGPSQFRAVAAVCPSVNLAASADALHVPANRLYEYYFMWQLRRRLRVKAGLFPQVFDRSRARGVTSLRDFDDKVTAYYCGFDGASDYYQRSAAANVVDRIAVPTLILHAANDPFIRILPETRQKILSNRNITFVETEDGGHCSFLAQPDGDDGRWAERQVVEFLRTF